MNFWASHVSAKAWNGAASTTALYMKRNFARNLKSSFSWFNDWSQSVDLLSRHKIFTVTAERDKQKSDLLESESCKTKLVYDSINITNYINLVCFNGIDIRYIFTDLRNERRNFTIWHTCELTIIPDEQITVAEQFDIDAKEVLLCPPMGFVESEMIHLKHLQRLTWILWHYLEDKAAFLVQ